MMKTRNRTDRNSTLPAFILNISRQNIPSKIQRPGEWLWNLIIQLYAVKRDTLNSKTGNRSKEKGWKKAHMKKISKLYRKVQRISKMNTLISSITHTECCDLTGEYILLSRAHGNSPGRKLLGFKTSLILKN